MKNKTRIQIRFLGLLARLHRLSENYLQVVTSDGRHGVQETLYEGVGSNRLSVRELREGAGRVALTYYHAGVAGLPLGHGLHGHGRVLNLEGRRRLHRCIAHVRRDILGTWQTQVSSRVRRTTHRLRPYTLSTRANYDRGPSI